MEEKSRLLWINMIISDALFHWCPSLVEAKLGSDWIRLLNFLNQIARLLAENYENTIIVFGHGFKKHGIVFSVDTVLYCHGLVKAMSKKMIVKERLDQARTNTRA